MIDGVVHVWDTSSVSSDINATGPAVATSYNNSSDGDVPPQALGTAAPTPVHGLPLQLQGAPALDGDAAVGLNVSGTSSIDPSNSNSGASANTLLSTLRRMSEHSHSLSNSASAAVASGGASDSVKPGSSRIGAAASVASEPASASSDIAPSAFPSVLHSAGSSSTTTDGGSSVGANGAAVAASPSPFGSPSRPYPRMTVSTAGGGMEEGAGSSTSAAAELAPSSEAALTASNSLFPVPSYTEFATDYEVSVCQLCR